MTLLSLNINAPVLFFIACGVLVLTFYVVSKFKDE